MIRILAAIVLIAAAVVARAEDEPVTTFTLDNGMQVVVVEDHRAPVVLHMVWYRAGSADEPAGQSGVAHFLEHLLFKATDTLASGEFSATVAANGGRDNAFTSYDYTGYFQRVASDRLGLMMQMEADRMRNIAFTRADFETERGVILEERNQRTENDPGALLREQMNAVMYLNHGYGTPIIGWWHEMEELTYEQTYAFYERYYHPNNAILVVAGDVTPEEVRALADEHYGRIPAKDDLRPRERTREPPQRAAKRVVLEDPRVAQPYVSRTYLAPERDPGNQQEAAALTLLGEIFGGGPTSVLSERLQFETKEAVYAGAFYRGVSLDDTGFYVVVVPAPGLGLEEAEAAMDREIDAFLNGEIDVEQLDRIKRQLRASQIYARDDVEAIGNRYGQALSAGLTVEDVQAWPDILQAVTPEQIMAAAQRVFNPKASVTGWLVREEPEVSQ